MNDIFFNLASTTYENGYLVITRSKIPNVNNGQPAPWEFTFFYPKKANLAYKMYNNGINLPEQYETYIMAVRVPAWCVHNVPYGSVNEKMVTMLLVNSQQ